MIVFLMISALVTLLAYFSERKSVVTARDRLGRSRRYRRREIDSYGFYSILIILVVFVGLRGSFNDTWAYIYDFDLLDTGMQAFEEMDWDLADNPGFYISNVFIKTVISENAQVMLILYSWATLLPFFLFYRRWSAMFWLTVFLFTASSMLLFSMAAMKQVLAMAIGLCGVNCFLKGERYRFVAWVLLGSTIHPYVPFYFFAFFLHDRVWSRKILLVIFLAALGGVFIEQFLQIVSGATQMIGAEYEKHGELSGPGMNFLRFLFYCISPILTWVYRHQINENRDKMMILFSNLTLIGWCFLFTALFVSANMFGRMAAYFDPFMHLSLTTILVRYIPKDSRWFIVPGCVAGYFLFIALELHIKGFVY